MALLFMDSFDHYVTADINEKWTASGSGGISHSSTILPTSGRRSLGCWRWTTGVSAAGQFGYLQKTLATPATTVILGFAYNPNGPPASAVAVASLRDGTTTQIWLRLNINMTLSVQRGATILGTTPVPLSTGIYTHIEWKTLIADSGGTSEVRFNGVPVLSLTGQDTQNTANTQCTSVVLGMIDSGNSVVVSKAYDFDDFYVLDDTGSAPWNDFLGDIRVDAHFPNAVGTYSMSVASNAGDRYATVDETAPNDDTDYNTVSALNDMDTMGLMDLIPTGSEIIGVQVCASIKKTDAGSVMAASVLRHGGVDYAGTPFSFGTTYNYLRWVYPTNPGTGEQFTEAEFNALEVGYKRAG